MISYPAPTGSHAKSSQINLGDLAKALKHLASTEKETTAAIARLLGFETISKQDGKMTEDERMSEIAPFIPERGSASYATPKRMGKTLRPASAGQRLQPLIGSVSDTRSRQEALQGPAIALQRASAAELVSPEPLFQPRTVRSIVFFALATIAREGDIDIQSLIRFLTFQDPWRGQMPRLPRPTVQLGVHVVFDRRSSMSPYYLDQNAILEVIRSVVGGHRTTYSYFLGSPHEVFSLGETSPRPRVPTLLLSDLGIGTTFDSLDFPDQGWSSFLVRLQKIGCPTVAFVPFSPSRWPSQFKKQVAMVHWDRAATPSAVRRRIGHGHDIKCTVP